MAAAQQNDEAEFDDNEAKRIRARIHNLADKVQGHEIFLETHRSEIARNKEDLIELRRTVVFQSQFQNISQDLSDLRIVAATKAELVSEKMLINSKLDSMEKNLNAIREAFGWGIKIIVGAVIMALMALVLKGKIG